MKISVTLSYDEDIDQWGSWIPGVAVYGQGDSPQEALESLKEGLALYIEEVGQEKFLEEIDPPSQSLILPLSDLVPST